MQSTRTSTSTAQNVLRKIFPGDHNHKLVYLRSPSSRPYATSPASSFKLSFRDTEHLLTPIGAESFFTSDLQVPSSFAIDPQRVQSENRRKMSTTESILNTIYVTSRASEDRRVFMEAHKTTDFQGRNATVNLVQDDKFTLDILPEEALKEIRDTDLLSRFSSIGCTVRSTASIVPQVTENLVNDLKFPDGQLMYLPLEYPVTPQDDFRNRYEWMSIAFPSEVEVTFEADSEMTRVLPKYDTQSTKQALKDYLGERSFVIPATSLLRVQAEAD